MVSKTLLIIDWDFFVPEDIKNDWAHDENRRAFFNLIWYIRAAEAKVRGHDLEKEMTLNGRQATFWRDIAEKFIIRLDTPMVVCDSHRHAFTVAQMIQADTAYSFDSHVDIGYHGYHNLHDEAVDCGNWLGKLLMSKTASEAHLILNE